jgi:glycosyltransferase involved in cell wall biosynthesis
VRILTLSNSPLNKTSGSGKSVLKFSEALRENGAEVFAFGPESFEFARSFKRLTKFRQAWGAWQFARKFLKAQSVDVVELYGDEFYLVTRWLNKQAKKPLIVAHTNGLELLDWERKRDYDANCFRGLRGAINRKIHIPLSRYFFSSVDKIVTLCQADADYVIQHKIKEPKDVHVVLPGIDSINSSSVTFDEKAVKIEKTMKIAYMGSWIERKGIKIVIEVVSRLMQEISSLQFDIFGCFDAQATILQSFQNQFHNRITVHPVLDEKSLYQQLALCRVFLFPSQYEGFGLALAEAMACGCAAVTSPTGFGSELVNHREAIVVPFNDKETFFKESMKLLTNKEHFERISVAGRERTRQLRWHESGAILYEKYRLWVS